MHARRTLLATLACLSLAAGVRAQTVAIAGFDYTDTSGESETSAPNTRRG